MTSLACLGAGRLIDQRAAGLDAAEQLRLEEHLEQCDDCSAHAWSLDRLHGLVDSEPPMMGSERRLAILDEALAASTPIRGRAPALLRRRAPLAVATLVLAAAAALVIGVRGTVDDPAAGLSATDSRLLSGAIRLDGEVLEVGQLLPANQLLTSDEGAELAFGSARVELRAGSRVRWQPGRSALELNEGSLVAEVDPRANTRFVVQTPKFQVEVTGTRFWVTLGGVGVERGSVRVLSADGRVLNAHLTAGSRWRVPSTDTDVSAAADEAELPEEASKGRSAGRKGSRADVGDLLLKARASIGHKDLAEARRLIRRALAGKASRRQRAEGRTLQAECELVEGNGQKAARIYRDVADRFRALPAGENALFAAARIHATREQRAKATKLLLQYQSRYPEGRFRQEVATRLKALQTGE